MNRLQKTRKFFKENYLFILIFLLAIFLRFFNLEQKTSFLGEQGRDLLIARSILVDRRLTLLGPPTSLSENIHFGPFYHYFNAFWLALFRFDPIGPAFGFGVLNLIACLFLYLTAVNFGCKKGGLFAAFLFAVSPLMIQYSQSMFNSFFVVSFTIIAFYFLAKFLKTKKTLFLLPLGIFSGLNFQANFLAYGFLIAVFIWLFTLKRGFWRKLSWFLAGVLIAILPYLIFEIRHQFFNLKGLWQWFNSSSDGGFGFFGFLVGLPKVFYQSFYFSLGNQNFFLTIFLVSLTLAFLFFFWKKKDKFLKLILLFFFISFLGLNLYRGELLSHYLGVVYPFVFLYFGWVFEKSLKARFKFFPVFLLCFVALLNLSSFRLTTSSGYGMPKGWNMQETKKAAKIIAEDAQGNFNVANVLDGDTRAYAYRYLLEVADKKPMRVEEYPRAETLYVIGRGDEQRILSYPVWEIYSLASKTIEKTWFIKDDISIFKLKKR